MLVGDGAFGFGGELVDDEEAISTQMDDSFAAVQLSRQDHFRTLVEDRLPRVFAGTRETVPQSLTVTPKKAVEHLDGGMGLIYD